MLRYVAFAIRLNANEMYMHRKRFYHITKYNQFGVLFTDYENIFSIFHHYVRQKNA